MSTLSEAECASIREMVKSRPDGFSLARPFYFDQYFHTVDMLAIWRSGWLFAGHSCEIPAGGCYVNFQRVRCWRLLSRTNNFAKASSVCSRLTFARLPG